MSSNKRMILSGKKIELEEKRKEIIIKLKTFSQSLEEHCSILLIDEFENMDENAIKVYSEELIKQIISLRKNSQKLKEINDFLGDE